MSTKKSTNNDTVENTCPKCGHESGSASFCPDCGAKVRATSTEEKRARLEQQGAGRRSAGPVIAVAVALALAGVGYFVFKGGGVQRAQSVATSAQAAATSGGNVTIPVGTFEDNKARSYSWKAPSGKTIQFFVLKSSDGVIRSAFDACDVCFAAKKGYRQDGDFMVCNNCGQAFESIRVNEVKGGCNPSPLERTIENGQVVITAAALQTGEKYF